jgi:superfamily II DNA or RNA helicase
MFGTGVDVDRLNLMVVAGQPKTTAQYIQATGRVGRGEGALVTTYLRASRPRDLDHYERFLAYHLRIHSEVEPVTVRPFALPVISKAAGPLMVGWLRNSRLANTLPWRTNTSSGEWMEGMTRPPEFDAFIDMLMSRNGIQVEERRIDSSPPNAITNLLEHGQHRWATISSLADDEAVLDPQKAMRWTRNPFNSLSVGSNVVLGGEEHVKNPTLHTAVYSPDHPAPQSLRAVDSTVGVKTRGRD